MMIIKKGVRVYGLRPEILLAVIAWTEICRVHGVDCVITCVIDGKHSTGSFHYNGLGIDFRTADLHGNLVQAVDTLKTNLGADYDVVLEGDHVHVEFQPKEQYTI